MLWKDEPLPKALPQHMRDDLEQLQSRMAYDLSRLRGGTD